MLTPEERASDLTKWVAADLRPRQWTAIRAHPLVSVVMPCLNEAEGVGKCVEKALTKRSATRRFPVR